MSYQNVLSNCKVSHVHPRFEYHGAQPASNFLEDKLSIANESVLSFNLNEDVATARACILWESVPTVSGMKFKAAGEVRKKS